MKKVTIYTDGACSGNPGPGGWGISACADMHDVPARSPLTRQELGDDKRTVASFIIGGI